TIRVVVAALCVPDFIAAEQHGRAQRQAQRRQQGPAFAGTQSQNVGTVRVTLHPVVDAQTVCMAVPVLFAIGTVVATGIAQQIAQREPVMRGNVVQAAAGSAPHRAEYVAGARQAAGQTAARALAVEPECSLGIAKAVVPLQPAGWKTPKLIATRANVPRLGDHQPFIQHRILRDRAQPGSLSLESTLYVSVAAREGRGQ